MRELLLIARRDYLAYVGAWGFWLSLFTAPLLLAGLVFGPVLLARSEPSRVLTVVADRAADKDLVEALFETRERRAAREALETFLTASSAPIRAEALAAFDSASDRVTGLAAARAVLQSRQPGTEAAFADPVPRYQLVPAPAATPEALRPYLTGARTVALGAEDRPLFGAIHITRAADGTPAVTYWSTNLTDGLPLNRARDALAQQMRREALARVGLDQAASDRIETLTPTTSQIDPRAATAAPVTAADRAPFLAAIIFGFVLWSAVFGIANMLLTSVLEEKSNKILDTLLTSVSPLQLLIGKLVGVAAVSVTLFSVWGLLGSILLHFASTRAPDSLIGQIATAALTPELLGAFLLLFALGYLFYGAVFLALGSLCETIQEAQALMAPIFVVLVAPMMLLGPAFNNPNAPLIGAASWFPPFTPFLLMMRAPTGLGGWELIGPLVGLAVTVAVTLVLAARLFRAGVVHGASAASLRRLLPGLRG